MTVKGLINELLDMPMDAEIKVVYTDEDYDYEYQDVMSAVYYDDNNEVGILGIR